MTLAAGQSRTGHFATVASGLSLFLAFGGLQLRADEPSSSDAVDVLTGNALEGVQQPQVAVSSEGKVAVAFGAGTDIYCVISRSAVSADEPLKFRPPVRIGSLPKLALGARRGPRIVWTSAGLVVTALGHADGNVWAWRSTDEGRTWQEPVQVNDVERSAREGLHGMATGSDGLIYTVWLDLRSTKTEVYGASSRDGGATWDKNRLVYRSPGGAVCECCHPSVTITSDGRVLVLFRNALDGNRDMYLSELRPGAEDFLPAIRVGTGNWKLKACPMDGGAVAVTPQGQIETVWRREDAVFRTTLTLLEQRLGPGEQPWATATEAGVYLVWLSNRGGQLYLLGPSQTDASVLAEAAGDPALAAAPGGIGPVVAVWEAENDGQRSVMAQVLAEKR